MRPAFTVLLDSPDEPLRRIPVAELGTFSDPRYGEFSITSDDFDDWKRNLSALPGGEALIDFEHRSERKPRDSKAAGWIKDLELDGNKVMAALEWTPGGEQAIRNKEYRFVSPVFGPYSTQTGDTLDNVFQSLALTNKPFLGSLPAITLASAERVSAALDDDPASRFYARALDGDHGEVTRALVLLDVSQAERDRAKASNNSLPDSSYPINNVKQLHAAAVLAASKHGDYKAARKLIRRRARELGVDVTTLPGFAKVTADSRPPMHPDLLKLLDLPEGADDRQLLDAVTKLAKKARKQTAEPVKTLEQQAAAAGKIVLDADKWDKTVQRAKNGAAALERVTTLEQTVTTLNAERADQRFEHAFNTALNDPQGARVTPAEKDDLKHFYQLDADATLKMIEARTPIVNARPAGAAAIELDQNADPQQVAAHGLHPDSHQLDQRIRKYMLDKGMPPTSYVKVFEQVQTGQVQL